MPTRKASGTEISETVVIAFPSTIGCQPYRARSPQTIAKAKPIPTGIESAARYQPGALSRAAMVTECYLPDGFSRASAALYLRRPLRFDHWSAWEPSRRLDLA